MFAGITRFLFGYDVFISYSYRDGKAYAEALDEGLSRLDFTCFLDRKELPYGGELRASLRRAIARSKVVVLVGSATVPQAPYVRVELIAALTSRRTKLIPIDVDGIRENFRIDEAPDLPNLPWLNEDPASAAARAPSEAVLGAISRHFGFTRRNALARRAVGVAAIVFFALSVVSVWQWREAVVQRDTAISRELAAKALLLVAAEPDTALLVAVESALVRDTFEARDALLAALSSRPGLQWLLHDAGQVRQVRFSPDGRWLLSIESGRKHTVWDLETQPPTRRPAAEGEGDDWGQPPEAAAGRVEQRMKEFSDAGQKIRAHAVSPDARTLATADGERVALWHLPTGKPLGEQRSAQRPYVRALAFSSTGLLASGSSDGTIAIWRVEPDLPIGRSLVGLATSANSVVFNSAGSQIAAGGYGGDVMRWNVLTGDPVGQRLMGPSGSIGALRFCDRDQAIVSAGSATIRWDLAAGERAATTHELPRHAEVAISPDCSRAVIGANDGQVSFVELATGAIRVAASNEHNDRTFALAFDPSGGVAASGGNDRRIVLWDAATATPSGKPLEGHSTTIAGLAFNAGGNRLASLASDGTLIVWDVDRRESIGRPLTRGKEYAGTSALALSPDATTAATSTRDGRIELWDVASWRALGRPLAGHPANVVAMRFSSDGHWLASAGLGGTVIVWDLRTPTWIAAARRIANRDLTDREREVYLGQKGVPAR